MVVPGLISVDLCKLCPSLQKWSMPLLLSNEPGMSMNIVFFMLYVLHRCLIPEAEEEPPKELPVWDEAVTRWVMATWVGYKPTWYVGWCYHYLAHCMLFYQYLLWSIVWNHVRSTIINGPSQWCRTLSQPWTYFSWLWQTYHTKDVACQMLDVVAAHIMLVWPCAKHAPWIATPVGWL